MGCVSSRHFRKDLKREILLGNGGDYTHHVVSLTSSTYGLLNLDKEQTHHHQQQQPIKEIVMETKRSPPREEEEEPPEVINAWELMEDLEEGGAPISIHQPKRSPIPPRRSSSSPLKFLNSPKKFKKLGGKENNQSPKIRVPKSPNLQDNHSRKITPILKMKKGSSTNEGSRVELGVSSRRRSLGPLFDPDLLESYQKELSEEEEQIKNMVSVTTPTNQKSLLPLLLQSIPSKSPPGGENTVVIYTTTLRGIRKTFEDCNKARSIIESHQVQMIERDVSMDSGFREELRGLMGTKEVRVPAVFVKGRLIGGAEELVSLEEGGKLGILLAGIPRGVTGCEGCAGVRFVMCMECSGSCKVLGEDGRKTVRCEECNENGLIHCPICC